MDIGRLIESALGGGGAGQQPGQTPSAPGTDGRGGGGLGQFANGLPGGLAGGAAAGGLVALMLGNKKARKLGGKVLTYGGLAAAAGLAYKAYSDYRRRSDAPGPSAAPGQSPQSAPQHAHNVAPPPALSEAAFDPATAQDATGGDLRLLLLRAMISAAKADGHIDSTEHKIIWDQVEGLALAPDEKAFLFDQVAAPADPIAIAQEARDEAQASEIYLVSLLAVDIDTQEERRYMERLADALRLPGPLRAELESQAAEAKRQAEG